MIDAGKIWMDGEFVDAEEAKISVLSHVVHYGSGFFEGIRCYKTERGGAGRRARCGGSGGGGSRRRRSFRR